jgi:hypothetical protein
MARNLGFWVILAGNTPTAFRGRDRSALLPTFKQLQRTQPTVSLQWFENNRLWSSPEEALAVFKARRAAEPRRAREWRPGGDHVDPRARFELTRDQKRARFKRNLRRPAGPAGRSGPGSPGSSGPGGPAGPDSRPRRPRPPRPPGPPRDHRNKGRK